MFSNIKGITVEIGGDTGPLDKALKEVNTTSRNLQSELRQVSRSLKFDPSSTEMLSQKQKILSESIENTKNKLEILKQAEAQVKEQFNNGELGEEKYRAFEREVENTENKLKNLEKQFNTSSPSLQAFGQKAGEIGEKLKAAGEKMESVGTSMTVKATAPIAAGFGLAGKAAMDFDHQMADIQKEIAAKGENVKTVMSQMSSMSIKWSQDFGQSTSDINQGLLTLVKDGYSGSEAMSIMQTSLYTARGANEDLATVVDQLGSSLESYGMKTNNATQTTQNAAHMADTFAYISNHTKASITSLGEAFSVVGATANSLKQPMAETAAAIGILESNGIDASTAANSLQAGLVNLTKPTKKMKEALDEMKFSAFDSKGNMKDLATILTEMQGKMSGWTNQQKEAAIATIFGKESLASWNVLMHKGGDYLKDLSTKANDATGEVKKLSDSMKNTDANKFKEFQESAHAMAVSIGQEVLPVFTPLIEKITAIIKSFSQLSPSTKKLIVDFGLVAAAIGPLLIFTGKLFVATGQIGTGISKLIGHFGNLQTKINVAGGLFNVLTKPITTLVSGFGSLGTKAVSSIGLFSTGLSTLGSKLSMLMVGPWKLLINGFKSLSGIIKNLSFTNIATKLIAPFKSLPTLLSGIFAKIPNAFGIFKTALTGLTSNVVSLGPKILAGIKSAFSIEGIMNGAKASLALFTSPWGALVLVIVAAVGAIIANWDTIKAWVTQHFGGTLPTSFRQFQEIFTQIWTTIQQVFTQVWNNIKNVVTQVWAYISPTIIGAVKQIQAFWNEVWPELKELFVEVWNVMKVVLAPAVIALYTIISTGIGLIKGIWGPAWNVLKDTLKTVWDAITGVIKVAWDIISGVLKTGLALATGNWSQAWNSFKGIFTNVWHDLGSLISNIAKDALKWGSDIIDGIVKGIKGAVGGLENAVGNVANTIRSYLHFSVPDKGPLSDADTYGGDFMQLLADTIDQNSNKPAEAAKKVADLVSQKIQGIKDTATNKVKELNTELNKLSNEETVALRGVKGNNRYEIQDEYDAKKKAVQKQIALAKDQANKEIAEIQRVGKMDKEQLQQAIQDRKNFVDGVNSLNDQIKDALKSKYTEEEKSEENSLNSKLDSLDKWKGASEDRIKNIFDYKKKKLEEDQKAQEKTFKAEEDSLDDWKEKSERNIEDVSNAKIAALQAQYDAIDQQEADKEREDKHKEYTGKIADLQNQIEYSHDDFNKAELQKELSKEQSEYQKELNSEALSDRKDSLKKQMDTIKDDADKQKQVIDDTYDFKKKDLEKRQDDYKDYCDNLKQQYEDDEKAQTNAIEKIYNKNKEALQKQLDDLKAFYEKKLSDANLEAESEKMIADKNQKDIITLLNSYGEEYKQAGQTLGDRLADGFKPAIDSIKSMISSITAEVSVARDNAISSMQTAKQATAAAITPKAFESISGSSSSKTYNTDNKKTVTNNFNFTHNSPTKATPSEERKQDEAFFRKAAFSIG